MRRIVSLIALFVPTLGLAQQQHHHPQPYAGLQARPIKALSVERIDDLRAGRGMGLALAAELNGYPGPLHVLELADPLALTPRQVDRTRELFAAMKAEAIPLGERVISAEAALDRLFAEGRATDGALAEATARIGVAEAQLRAAHLRYHLEMARLLDDGQRARYAVLRGYRP